MDLSEYYSNYVQLRPKLLTNARGFLKDTDNAEDLVEDTFMTGMKYLYDFHYGSLYAWLKVIMRRLYFRDYWIRKHRKKLGSMMKVNIYADNSPYDSLKMIRKVAEELPVKLRMIFELVRLEGYSQEEISEKLSLPLGTVKSRLDRADRIMRKKLEYMVYY